MASTSSIDGRPVAAYQTQPSRPARRATPGRTSDAAATCTRCGRRPGAIVTDDDVPGQPEQRGAVVGVGRDARRRAHGRTSGTPAAGTGAVEFEGVLETWSGPVVAGFRSRHRAVDRTVRPPLTAETETWQVTLPALGRVGPPPSRRST